MSLTLFWLSRSIQSILLHKKEGPQRRCGFGTRSTEVSNEQKNGARDGKQYAQTYKREQINKLHAQFPVPLLICEAPVCLASLITCPHTNHMTCNNCFLFKSEVSLAQEDYYHYTKLTLSIGFSRTFCGSWKKDGFIIGKGIKNHKQLNCCWSGELHGFYQAASKGERLEGFIWISKTI